MKEKRDRLFKRGRPNVRPLVIEENGKPHKDVGLLWVAYKNGNFKLLPRGMKEPEFFRAVLESSSDNDMYLIEDLNKEFSTTGPTAFISATTDGWKLFPHIEFFPWTTKRNMLKAVVSYLQMVRYKKIGCCVVTVTSETKPLLDKAQEYGVLNYVGKIPNGDSFGRGDEFIYYIRGKK